MGGFLLYKSPEHSVFVAVCKKNSMAFFAKSDRYFLLGIKFCQLTAVRSYISEKGNGMLLVHRVIHGNVIFIINRFYADKMIVITFFSFFLV